MCILWMIQSAINYISLLKLTNYTFLSLSHIGNQDGAPEVQMLNHPLLLVIHNYRIVGNFGGEKFHKFLSLEIFVEKTFAD